MINGMIVVLMSRALLEESNGIVAAVAATILVATTMLDRLQLQLNPSVNPLLCVYVNPLLCVYLLVSINLILMNLFQIVNRGHSHQR